MGGKLGRRAESGLRAVYRSRALSIFLSAITRQARKAPARASGGDARATPARELSGYHGFGRNGKASAIFLADREKLVGRDSAERLRESSV